MALAVKIAVVSAAACAVLVGGAIATLTLWQRESPAPAVTGPTLDPKYAGRMGVTPATAKPGQRIGATFTDPEFIRGVAFTLASATDGKVLYYIFRGRGEKPTWSSATDPNGLRPGGGAGVRGHGPDNLVVPDTAADGTYLLCTHETKEDQACALLTVAR